MKITDSFHVAMKLISLRRSQWWSVERIRSYQDVEVVRTLRFAATAVPYYRSLDIAATDIATAADLRHFPILTKQIQQANQERLLADGMTLDACQTSTTSGSTGEPTTVAFDRGSWLLCKYAIKIRRLGAYNLGIGKRILLVSELPPGETATESGLVGRGLVFGQRYVSIHEPVQIAIPIIEAYQPHAIYAFPSYLAELLEYCEGNNVSLPQVDVIFTSSEVLGAALRQRLAVFFGARVCDVYGSTEFKEVAWQCQHGSYHINFESTLVEIDSDNDNDGCGTVLLTSLVNRAMPLIRFRVGDRARMGSGSCACGREGPWIETVSGREVELLELPDGTRLSPYLLTAIVESDAAMRRYQIVQIGPASLEVRYLRRVARDVNETRLTQSLTGVLGRDMQVHFRHVEDLPRTPGGKQKVFFREFGPRAEA